MRGPRRIGVVGDVAFDYTIELDPAGSRDEKEAPLRTQRMLGGTGANAAAALRSLGSEVSLHSVVGDDPFGSWLCSALRDQGIATKHVRTVVGTSSVATILRRGEERTVIVDVGAGAVLEPTDLADLHACDIVYVSYSPQTVLRLVEEGLGERTVVGLEAWMLEVPGLRQALDRSRVVIGNDAAFAALVYDGRPVLPPLVRTRGAVGAEIHQPGAPTIAIPPYQVAAVDATGAGDCFAATLCHYLAEGTELADATALAAVAAALSTLAVGAQGRLPQRTIVEALVALPSHGTKGNGPGARAPAGE